MTDSEIRSGSKVIADFLDSKKDDKAIDADTLSSVRRLFDSKKLTKTQLLRALQEDREVGGPK